MAPRERPPKIVDGWHRYGVLIHPLSLPCPPPFLITARSAECAPHERRVSCGAPVPWRVADGAADHRDQLPRADAVSRRLRRRAGVALRVGRRLASPPKRAKADNSKKRFAASPPGRSGPILGSCLSCDRTVSAATRTSTRHRPTCSSARTSALRVATA